MTGHRWPVATATCPSGKTITGGGGRCVSLGKNRSGHIGWVFLYNNSPISATEWQVSCDTPQDQEVTAIANAICC